MQKYPGLSMPQNSIANLISIVSDADTYKAVIAYLEEKEAIYRGKHLEAAVKAIMDPSARDSAIIFSGCVKAYGDMKKDIMGLTRG